MATLTGRSPKDTYGDLLQVSNANDGVDSTLRFVSDGKGTNSSLKISSASAQFTGTLTSTGLLTTTAGIVSGSNIISDADSTDDLGSTGVRWANLWVDNITMGGTIAGAVATFSSTMTVTGLTTATGGIFTSGTIIFEGATADAHETTLTVVDPTADRTVSLPNATDTLVGKATTDTLTNKTLTSPVLNTGLSGTAFLDEDDMSSNSATKAASQQSIKAYVDAQVDTADTLSEILAIGNTTGGTDVSVSTDDKVQFRDAAIYINSSTDGQLDIVADTEIQIAATTIDINGAVALNGALTGITNITLSGELDAATGDFSGDVDVDGTLEADAITLGGTALGSLYSPIAGSSSIVTTGALNSGSITSGFGTINNGASAITTTGALGAGAATFGGNVSIPSGSLLLLDGSSDTYIREKSANEIQLVTGGAGALILDASQDATFSGDLAFSGGNVNVDGGDPDGRIIISSNTNSLGGNLLMYGNTHASLAGNVVLRSGTTAMLTANGSTSAATFAKDVSVKTSGVPTLAGGTPYGLLVKSGGANSNGTYQASIGFTESSGGNVRAAIMSKQTGADNDQNGLAFMTHPSASNVDGAIALLLEHDLTATFAGDIIRKATPNGSVGGLAITDNGSGPLVSIGDTGTTLNTLYDFYNGNGIVGKIQTNGSGTAFVTSSDYRLKENVVTDWDATTRLKQLKPSRFNFIADANTTVDGFLAHEAQAVVPECATGLKDAMKDERYEVSAATGEVFTPAIEEVTIQSQVMETVETGSYVNLAGETIVETEQRGVTTETTETVVQRQDIDGVSTEVEVEVTTQVATMETVITTAAVSEIVHSTDVVQPETLSDGQQWRETTAQVMATRSVPDHQGIDQSKLVPLLVKTIQELEARITTLET